VDGSPQRDLLATDWTESFGSWSRTADEFVYVSDRGGKLPLWISSADQSWQSRIANSEDVGETSQVSFRSPEFSPDGKRICYIAGRRVWISPASGGRPSAVTRASQHGREPDPLLTRSVRRVSCDPSSCSRDLVGMTILFTSIGDEENILIWRSIDAAQD